MDWAEEFSSSVCRSGLLANLPQHSAVSGLRGSYSGDATVGTGYSGKPKTQGIRWFRVAYYIPVVISIVVAGIAWKWLYAENGLLNQVLKLLGLSQDGIPWLTSPQWAIFSVMAVTVWKGLGYYMVIYLAGLQAIPADLYEAAAIDGSDGIKNIGTSLYL